MAPGFLSRLVKTSPTTTRTDRDSSTHRRSPSTPNPLGAEPSHTSSPAPIPAPASSTLLPKVSDASLDTTDSGSTKLNVTVVPPSPHFRKGALSNSSSEYDLHAHSDRHLVSDMPGASDAHTQSLSVSPRLRAISAPSRPASLASEDNLVTPKAEFERPSSRSSSRSRPSTPNSFSSFRQKLKSPSNVSLSQGPGMRRKSSNKSLKIPAPIVVPPPVGPPILNSTDTPDAQPLPPVPATSIVTMSPIVESPERMRSMEDLAMQPFPHTAPVLPRARNVNGQSMLQAPTVRDSDSTSLSSRDRSKDKEKKKPWRRGSGNSRKTGLAGAIAASGLATANTAMSQAHYSASMIQISQSNSTTSRTPSNGQPPSTPYTGSHAKSRSVDLEPRSARSKSPVVNTRRRTTASSSIHSDNNSEYYPDVPDYFDLDADSGLEDRSETDDETDLDLDDDIPVTGFAVASHKRNADFHELFPSIPEGDYLIEDYGCALQREILIQGRMHVSENHICFHANIFGWITDLSIPIYDITSLEKKMTAFVIPNGIQITTHNAKYTFASFLSRDTTFDLIYNIWRHARPDDSTSIFSSARASLEGPSPERASVLVSRAAPDRVTQCACGRDGSHFPDTALEVIVPGTPDRIHNLIFASGFIKDFMTIDQKLTDIQVSDWRPIEPGSMLLARNMSYIKPLKGSLGPKQAKCEIRDETIHADPEDYLTMLTTTRTPDVPSGGVFSVRTRTCIMWASAITSKVVITTQVEWTGRSFLKGIIEKSAIEGQKVYHAELERAMRAYIQEHQSEFVPAGVDPSAIELVESVTVVPIEADKTGVAGEPLSEEAEWRQREHERNRRGLQWAWDTFDGAYQVAKRSTKGALELIRDAWDQSSTTTILWFVIVLLVISNLWTFVRIGSREEYGRRKELRRSEDRDRWVQGVVSALRDEFVGKPVSLPFGGGSLPPIGGSVWHSEVVHLRNTLEGLEDRIRHLRDSLEELTNGNAMHTLD
ncbi:hypothetical protein APHAL10511_002968 [Amanita phalloides]|nr:hypothetical protein APHAL10511_002968 [Amanita phalloides]